MTHGDVIFGSGGGEGGSHEGEVRECAHGVTVQTRVVSIIGD